MDIAEVNKQIIEHFRDDTELPAGMHRDRLLLLTTIGRTSGEPRTAPMMYHRDTSEGRDDLYVIASNNGAEKDPEWYRNLMKDAGVVVEIVGHTGAVEQFDAVASTISGDKRERMWTAITAENPFFVKHQKHIARQIPVVELSRIN